MIKKLFYTKPAEMLHMYMEFKVLPEEFELKFEVEPLEFDNIIGVKTIISGGRSTVTIKHLSRMYVQPDSYHIFEPKFGDMVMFKNGQVDEVRENFMGADMFVGHGGKILQRNSKLFFWPESEV